MADEDCDSEVLRKPRKLWIESTPFTPEGYRNQSSIHEESTPARVRLTHFTTKPVIDFGYVKVGKTVTRQLVIENPNFYDVDVSVEKFPWKKNFSIDQEIFNVDEGSVRNLKITWTPTQSGNCRELVMIKYDSGFRVHAVIIGHADSPKKKQKIKTRRGQALNRTLKKCAMHKLDKDIFAECSSHITDNLENIEPSRLISNTPDGSETSHGHKRLLRNHGSPMSNAASILNEKHEFSSLRSALLPLHVLNNDNNQRDSCGSITAPASPSGLDAPIVESSHASPAFKGLSTSRKPINSANLSSPKEDVRLETERGTFCIDPKRSHLPNRCSDMTEPEITGRPTYVFPSMRESDPPFPPPSSAKAPLRNKRVTATKETLHSRSPTSANNVLSNSEGEDCIRLDMLDYALSVIGSDKNTEALDHDFSPPDSLDAGTLEMEELTFPNPVIRITPVLTDIETTTAIDVRGELAERFSSTCTHERTIGGAIGCLPVPDISLITSNSPLKTQKRKSSEFSPNKEGEPRGKKAIIIHTGDGKASPRKPAKSPYVTPKGRALRRHRAAKGSASETLPIPNFGGGSAKKKASGRLLVTNKIKKSVESPSSEATKRSVIKKRKVKMPVTKLVLKPSQKTVVKLPVIFRMAYSSGNRYYDERWRQKQEYAYTTWLNYILTPDEFKVTMEGKEGPSKGKNKGMHHSEVFSQNFDKCNITLPALSREKASLRAYRITKRLNSLRRAAVNLFESKEIRKVIRKIEEAVETGHIQLRSDKQLWADVGNKGKVIELLLKFHPLWLRLGLEVTFGVELFTQANTDMNVLSNFITRKLLSSVEIEKQFSHPTVPHSFKPGYSVEISKHILKRFLILIYFLEQAKQHRLIDHDPCLFRKESEHKNCKDILISFSRDLLRGEGDVIKHLSFLGYKVNYQQTYIDEFEFGISNIAIDLRDGIRLVRIVELLFHRHDLTSIMRVPAGSLLQKKHNVNIALKALESHGVEMCDASGKKIEADHIAKGHCEMTLALLWNIASHFQLEKGIDQEGLKGEIEYLKKNLRLKHMMQNTKNFYEEEDSAVSKITGVSALLLEWCRLVCAFKSIPVYNFGAAMSDGRILASLVSHYQSNLVHSSQICMKTTLSQKDSDLMLDDSPCFEKADSEPEINPVQLVRNEKQNLKLVQNAAYQMGGIPCLLRIDDICNTIPDDKVVRLFVAFLCVRLLDIGSEDRAARTIQVAWRAYNYKKKILAERKALGEEMRRRSNAATVIQAAYKAYRQRFSFQKLKAAALVMQRAWRSRKDVRPFRKEFLKLKSATIFAQSLFRAKMARKFVVTLMQERAKRSAAASKLQYFCRGKVLRKEFQRKRRTVIAIQRFFRAWLASKTQRSEYLAYRSAVRTVQIRWREMLEMRKQVVIYSTKREAVMKIQRVFRAHLVKKSTNAAICIQRKWRATLLMNKAKVEYCLKHVAIVTIQNAYRSLQARRTLSQLKRKLRCVIIIQRKWKATLATRSQRETFLRMKACAITIQTAFRSLLARRILKKLKMRLDSAKIIQQGWRACVLMKNARREFLKGKDSAIRIQCAWRCFLARKEYARMQKRMASIFVIQRRWRATVLARKERKNFLRRRNAAIKIQSALRGVWAKRKLTKQRLQTDAAMVIQKHWRATMLMKTERNSYLRIKAAAIKIQYHVRRILAKNEMENLKIIVNAARIIQAYWRGFVATKSAHALFLQQKQSSITIQSYFRRHLARKILTNKKKENRAAKMIQRKWRATRVMKMQRENFLTMKNAAIVIQCVWRCYLAKRTLAELKKRNDTVMIIQRKWQATLLMRRERHEYVRMKSASVVVQCAFRCFQARRILVSKRERLDAAIVVQRKWRATLKMKDERQTFICKRDAAIMFQSAFRGFLARKVLLHLKKEFHAAQIIQKRWRAYCVMKQVRGEFLLMKKRVILIQIAFKGMLTRRRLSQRRDAAVFIQHLWRATLKMKTGREEFLRKKRASVIIQCAWRCFAAKNHLEHLRKQHNAALLIQGKWRARVLMKTQRTDFLKIKIAAIKLQSIFRCILAKRELARLRNCQTAAIIIQQKWRATWLMRNTRTEFLWKKSAAVIIQCSYRSFMARKLLSNLQKRNTAACVIQRRWRATLVMRSDKEAWEAARIIQAAWKGLVLMKRQRGYFLNLKKSAIIIQCMFRCYVARKTVTEMRKQDAAARKIQIRWRATLCMKKERQQFLSTRNAVIVIQSHFRRTLAQKILKQLTEDDAAAKIIQRRWRATLLMRRERDGYLKKKNAVVVIQRFLKRLLAKGMLSNMKEKRNATIVIQKGWRALVAMRNQRKEFLLLKRSAIIIQCAIRKFLAKKIFGQLKKEWDAANLIKMHWRSYSLGKRERQRFKDIVESVGTIQRVFRGYLIRRVITDPKVVQARKKCIIANRYARQHPNRKICNRMNSALTLLLEAKSYDTVYSTLEDLYTLSLLLPYCCERISEAGGTEVLCQLITSSNRSFHAAFVQRFSINILLNLIKNTSTRSNTGQILGTFDLKSDSTAIEMLVNVLSRFRDKGGRDPSHIIVFCAACTLLIEFCRDEENVEILKSKTKSVEMIQYINRETMSRMKTKVDKTKEARRRKDRESTGYLTLSSSFANTSVLNSSTLLDVTARETNLVRDRRVFTPKVKQSRANTENKDPTVAKQSHSRNASTVVSSLFKDKSLPPKLKQSILPQKASWNTNIPIHRSKKVTKPQSPKFQSSFRSKKPTVGSTPQPMVAIQNHPQRNVIIKLADITYNDNDPLSCINALSGMLV